MGWKFITRTECHELNQRAIGLWKYICTRIDAYLKNQVKNHSKIDNSVNNQKSKIFKSNLSKAWKEKRDNMLVIMSQTSLFLLLNIMRKKVGTLGYQIWVIFWSGDNLVKFRNIKNTFWYLKMISTSTYQWYWSWWCHLIWV